MGNGVRRFWNRGKCQAGPIGFGAKRTIAGGGELLVFYKAPYIVSQEHSLPSLFIFFFLYASFFFIFFWSFIYSGGFGLLPFVIPLSSLVFLSRDPSSPLPSYYVFGHRGRQRTQGARKQSLCSARMADCCGLLHKGH